MTDYMGELSAALGSWLNSQDLGSAGMRMVDLHLSDRCGEHAAAGGVGGGLARGGRLGLGLVAAGLGGRDLLGSQGHLQRAAQLSRDGGVGRAWVRCGSGRLRPRLTPATVLSMATEGSVIKAKLHRIVLDEALMAEKRAEDPNLPARELSPELWVVFRDGYCDEEGKDFELAAMVGLVLAQARTSGRDGASVSWTLTGTPPEGQTLAEAVADLGIALYERWPATWR